jgi:hypothetical protein
MKQVMLTISIVGIFLLLAIIKFQTIESAQISSISPQSIGKEVKITGSIISFKEYENDFKILRIKDIKGNKDIITVTCNCIEIKPYMNKTLEITGKIEEYNSQLQINADKINIKE